LSRAFYGLSQRRAEAEQELHRLATTDVLTGLNNRRMFDAFLPQALARARARASRWDWRCWTSISSRTSTTRWAMPAGDQVLIEFARPDSHRTHHGYGGTAGGRRICDRV
jgi:predicted signal transduction protein with EAL and GGDEF domain